MPIDSDLLEILVCPESHAPLTLASDELVCALNARVAAGEVQNLGGKGVEKPLPAGLVREGEDRLYPIIDDIPILLIEEAIALTPS